MNDTFRYSIPILYISNVLVRVHIFTLIFMLAVIGRANKQGFGWEAAGLMGILLLTTLLHELGHSFAARYVDGDSDEILLWPLGGLAKVDIPNNPRAHFLTAIGGPAVDFTVCMLLGTVLLIVGYWPPINPFWNVFSDSLWQLGGTELQQPQIPVTIVWLARAFWLSLISFCFNIILVGYPMDSGRMLQAILWPRVGYHQSTMIACFGGYICAAILILFAYYKLEKNTVESAGMMFIISTFIIVNCLQKQMQLEMGQDEEGFMGYDFSQGYTSLEKEEKPKRSSALKEWMEKRADDKRRKEKEQRKADAKRLDELLIKVKDMGMDSLSSEEQKFLKRVSAQMREKDKEPETE